MQISTYYRRVFNLFDYLYLLIIWLLLINFWFIIYDYMTHLNAGQCKILQRILLFYFILRIFISFCPTKKKWDIFLINFNFL